MSKEKIRDYSRNIGAAAIGGRLRRLIELIDGDVTRIYGSIGVKFEQRWFGVINQLALNGPMSVSEISEALGITHVSVSQTRKSLENERLINSAADPKDGRRRILELSPTGVELVKKMGPFWKAFEAAAVQLNSDADNILKSLDRLDDALGKRSMFDRIADELDGEKTSDHNG